MDYSELKAVLEGLLFVAGDEGLSIKQLADVCEIDKDTVRDVMEDLAADFNREKRGLQIIEIAGNYQMTTRPEHAPYFRALVESGASGGSSLSQAALETLAIIAYKQPITRAEIEDIRGVKSEKPIQTLLTKQLIKQVGRAESVGRPFLYGTTPDFLTHFGLNHPEDLPPLDDLVDPAEVEAEHKDLFTKPSLPDST